MPKHKYKDMDYWFKCLKIEMIIAITVISIAGCLILYFLLIGGFD
jgi:hypothetical protein